MNFNSLFFPAPKDHYSVITHFGEMIFIPKEHEITKDELTGEEKPRLILNERQSPDSGAQSGWISPRHLHRDSSAANMTGTISEVENDYQLGTGPNNENNRQQEISIVT